MRKIAGVESLHWSGLQSQESRNVNARMLRFALIDDSKMLTDARNLLHQLTQLKLQGEDGG